MTPRRYYRLFILVALMLVGLWLELAGVLDAGRAFEFARTYNDRWWLALAIILVQAVMFTFALAGSLFLWVVAPLYPPPLAAAILAAGGALGGLGAYFFSRYLTVGWKRRVEKSRSYRLLQAQNNFFTLFAMRVFPGFPHALVNYSSGVLRARLGSFLAAALLGIYLKSFIYARVIHGATGSLSLDVLLEPEIIGPLAGLSLASLVAVFMLNRSPDNKA